MNALRRLGTVGSSSSAAQDKAAAAAAQGLDINGKPLERQFGLENFGNTCYCNAVLQALYFCKPFRELLELSSLTYTLGEDGVYRPVETAAPSTAQLSSALSTKEPGSPRQPGPTRTASGMRIPGVILAPEPASRPTLLPRKTAPNSPGQVKTPLSPLNTSQPLSPTSGPPIASPLQATPTVISPGASDDKGKKGPLSRGVSMKSGSSGGRGLFKKGLTLSSVPTVGSKQPNGSDSSRPGTSDGTDASNTYLAGSDSMPNGANGSSSAAPLTQGAAKTLQIPSNSHSDATTAMSPSNAVKPPDQTLFTALRDLFSIITHQPKQSGVVAPQAFVQQLRQDNEVFRSTMHQDAHEFFNFLMNEISEQAAKQESERQKLTGAREYRPSNFHSHIPGANAPSWVQDLFLGVLTNETRCLSCETVTSRDEAFLDLSIDIEQNTSVTACLRQFSKSEMLQQRDKYSCERCCSLQEAEKRMKIKKLPNILALHLKRFKYQEDLQRFMKLTYRVVFPLELRLFNTVDDAPNADRMYRLWAIVIHIGAGLHHGHYVAIVRSGEKWLLFDDDTVTPIEESEIPKYFGDTPGYGSGYVLFYQSVELDVESLLPLSVREGRRVEREAKEAALAARFAKSPISPTASSAPFASNQLYSIPQGDSPHLSPLYTAANLEKADPFATPVREIRDPFDASPLVDDGSAQPSQRRSIGHLRGASGDDLSQKRPGTSGSTRSPTADVPPQPPWSAASQHPQQRGTSTLTESMQLNGHSSTRRQHSLTLSTNVPPPSVAAAVTSSRGSSPARSKTEAPSPTTYRSGTSPFAPNGVSPLSTPLQSAAKDKEKEKGKWWKLGKK